MRVQRYGNGVEVMARGNVMSEGWMEWDGLGRSMEFGVVRILGGLFFKGLPETLCRGCLCHGLDFVGLSVKMY